MDVVNGRARLEEELGTNVPISESDVELRAIQGAFERTWQDLLSLEVTALASQLARMEHQRVGDEDPEPYVVLADDVHKTAIQRKLRTVSTVKSGFIFWLDFERESAANVLALLERPQLLPKLDGIAVVDQDLDRLDEDVNPRAPVNAKLAFHARGIAAVSRKQLEFAAKNILKCADAGDTRPIHGFVYI